MYSWNPLQIPTEVAGLVHTLELHNPNGLSFDDCNGDPFTGDPDVDIFKENRRPINVQVREN